ncbi:YpmS family protein [Streptococcus halichoeri]|uniref:YpmS family protein n=1 Tax=Streptococcus halichoeri TaxID=254785 RepID=UPI0013598ACD|nr:DUF2140 family protein [Streptococcus halichoeri]
MKTKPSINGWKWAFLLILALNLAFLIILGSRLIQPRETKDSQQSISQKATNVKVGTFTTNRQQLNKTISAYLKAHQSSKMSYKVYLAQSSILFEGKYQLLGYEVPLYVYFQPNKLENGAVQLQVTSFSVGTLPLPEAEVLQYIKGRYELPSFVTIKPKQSSIVLNVQKLKNNANIYLKAKKIDLLNDQISFDIYKK